MPHRNQRITLVAREETKPTVDWNHSRARVHRVAFLDSVAALRFALGAALHDVGLDVERVIIDRAGSAEEFLTMLAHLPVEFAMTVPVFSARPAAAAIACSTPSAVTTSASISKPTIS
jgi:hypothetical protein